MIIFNLDTSSNVALFYSQNENSYLTVFSYYLNRVPSHCLLKNLHWLDWNDKSTSLHTLVWPHSLTLWGWDKMDAISQTPFWSAFHWMKTWILNKISLKYVPCGLIDIMAALVQIMAWSQTGDKPLYEPKIGMLYWLIYASLALNELSVNNLKIMNYLLRKETWQLYQYADILLSAQEDKSAWKLSYL